MRQTLSDVAAVLSTQNYDPYGQPEDGTQPATFGYTGELQDTATSAVYLRARWYRPARGERYMPGSGTVDGSAGSAC